MKIGFLPLYIALYDECVPEKRPAMQAFADKIAGELAKRGLELIKAPICCLEEEFADAVRHFEMEGCEGIATLHLAYSPSLESAEILAKSPLPIVIIDTTPDYEFTSPAGIMDNHGIHGVQDLCNILLRKKKPFQIVCGHYEMSPCLDEAIAALTGARMAKKMQSLRIGRIGGYFKGMGDFRVPEGTFGMELVSYTPREEPSEEAVKKEIEEYKSSYIVDKTVTEEGLARTARACLKIRSFIEKEKLDAFTMTFLDINYKEGWETVPFLECSKAMGRGIGYAGEGDVLTAGLAKCLLDVFPETSFGEMFCPDWKNERIFTSHMGEINLALAHRKPLLAEKPYSFSDTGRPVAAYCCFKEGEAILTDLAPGPDGTFTLIVSKVRFEAPDKEASTSGNEGYFKPSCGKIAKFLKEYSLLGGTHHLCISYGGNIEILRSFAHCMGWRFAEI